jgi:Protein of unknown function (DUF1275)
MPGTGLRQSVAPQSTVWHMSEVVERRMRRFGTSLGESSLYAKLLPTVLSLITESVDAIGFLGLGGLFTAHVTGNLVILAVHLASGGEASVGPMLSVPVFVAALGLTRLLADVLERIGLAVAMGMTADLKGSQGS